MIEVRNLNFGYDENLVLEDINFSYKSKDFLAIIGPNGGGKSTLLKLMLGILEPKSGEISLLGKNPKEVSKQVGYVPQDIPVNKAFPISALEVVLMGMVDKKRFGFYTKKDKDEAMSALKTVGMMDFYDRRISNLSGGQRQRVYIARALCSSAKILFLDEPTASIDTRGQVEIYDLLKGINKQGVGVVVISHNINIAVHYATKVAYVSKNLIMHDIDIDAKDSFLNHLEKNHHHFCDVELILKECSCKKF
ncbi:MAG: ABC transporter ATP-binding protein [Campylobacter sp.]|nr:ABC transporter ATP-binding protein [Campylobacter sp.]